ncbi:hypothetical protein T11_9668 [Trichinella zimbabwensis]|uniref:Uncharacterized protein n=1 Tax=Trichinella zimbabwensis TaxID=268475 RepID=A0A0V1GCJ7_9BILA|nr:hypothetical protein T11_9668 [Trichinella zimbabwensis]
MYRDIIDGLKAAEKSEAFITVLEGILLVLSSIILKC